MSVDSATIIRPSRNNNNNKKKIDKYEYPVKSKHTVVYISSTRTRCTPERGGIKRTIFFVPAVYRVMRLFLLRTRVFFVHERRRTTRRGPSACYSKKLNKYGFPRCYNLLFYFSPFSLRVINCRDRLFHASPSSPSLLRRFPYRKRHASSTVRLRLSGGL